MKSLRIYLLARPWLLVVLAFVILISAWTTLMMLSAGVPSKRLSAEEEATVLERRARQ
ncbi:MAG: hypothetical protein ACOYM3_12950 [Terrimicrobiaceae bacterium]